MDSYIWERKCFATEAEARAFELGLTYGDAEDWLWYVDGTEDCLHPTEGREREWGVVFARREDMED